MVFQTCKIRLLLVRSVGSLVVRFLGGRSERLANGVSSGLLDRVSFCSRVLRF